MAKRIGTKVITGPKTRFSFVHLFEPYAQKKGEEAKYSVMLLIPKDDLSTLACIEEAIKEAYEQGRDTLANKNSPAPAFGSPVLKMPMHDGDEEQPGEEVYAGMMYVNARSKPKEGMPHPGICDAAKNDIEDPMEFYSGCYGRASICFYAFNGSGNRGIACAINNVQKLKDGPHLGGGRRTAQQDFADDEFDEDDLNDI